MTSAVEDRILDRVLDLEWSMFVRVKSDRNAPCQRAPDNFRSIRGALFDTWTEAMLASYLRDLALADIAGRNPLVEKYARMGDQMPVLCDDPLIDHIVAIEAAWQEDIAKRYPNLFNRCCRRLDPTGDGREFAVYLRSELETYGSETRRLYHENVSRADEAGRNLGLEALDRLVRRSGYHDLDHAESNLGKG